MQPIGLYLLAFHAKLAIRLNYIVNFQETAPILDTIHTFHAKQPLGQYQVDILHEKVKTEDNLAYVTL